MFSRSNYLLNYPLKAAEREESSARLISSAAPHPSSRRRQRTSGGGAERGDMRDGGAVSLMERLGCDTFLFFIRRENV